jgi:HD-GYP domain-containing protein (c-di-GMP phosphodiesterase class II)
MLKHITISDVEMGMFVHKMKGSWFSHPFWKAKFLIDDEEKLLTLRSSNLRGLVIDTAKGKDLTTAPDIKSASQPSTSGQAAAAPVALATKLKNRRVNRLEAHEPTSTQQEVATAMAVAERAQTSLGDAFIAARLGKAINVRQVQPVVVDILHSIRRNPHAFGGLMRCKLKNESAYRHALAVSALMVSLARQMKCTQTEIHEAGLAGLMLDIGTNYLPQNLNLPGDDFRNADPKIWKQHVILGHRALENDAGMPASVLSACLEHHERIDGRGYPNGLADSQISKIGRMAAICDTFDFLLTRTNTTEALDPAVAVERMREMEGAFDQEILRCFIESVGIYPVGSFVELHSGKIAMVIDEDPKDSSKPIVQAFYSRISRERILPHRIDLARCDDAETIVGSADLSELDVPDVAQLRELVFLTAYQLER